MTTTLPEEAGEAVVFVFVVDVVVGLTVVVVRLVVVVGRVVVVRRLVAVFPVVVDAPCDGAWEAAVVTFEAVGAVAEETSTRPVPPGGPPARATAAKTPPITTSTATPASARRRRLRRARFSLKRLMSSWVSRSRWCCWSITSLACGQPGRRLTGLSIRGPSLPPIAITASPELTTARLRP